MKKKRFFVTGGLVIALTILSGCVRTTKSGKPYGMVYDYLAKPMQHLMEWFAGIFGNSYGWAIVALVIIVRLILLPLMMSQMKKSTMMQERMSMLQPQMRALQERQKQAKTPEEQAAASQAMMSFYRDNNVSITGGIGCLPLLIQLPIFSALYFAIRYSPDLANAVFFGIHLGQRSTVLALLAFAAYLVQGWLSMLGVPEEQKKQMRMALLMSPVMILFISWQASAGLGLYFFIGGLFAILQTILVNAYRPRIRKQIHEEMKNKPVKPIVDVPASSSPASSNPAKPKNRNRNAGKQHYQK